MTHGISLIERLEALAEMLEADAMRALESDGATHWYGGKELATIDKVDWAIAQFERASALRSKASQ